MFFPEDNNNINNSNNDNNHHTLQSSTSPSGKMITASAWKVVAILFQPQTTTNRTRNPLKDVSPLIFQNLIIEVISLRKPLAPPKITK